VWRCSRSHRLLDHWALGWKRNAGNFARPRMGAIWSTARPWDRAREGLRDAADQQETTLFDLGVHFQQFCRDLHSEAVEHLLRGLGIPAFASDSSVLPSLSGGGSSIEGRNFRRAGHKIWESNFGDGLGMAFFSFWAHDVNDASAGTLLRARRAGKFDWGGTGENAIAPFRLRRKTARHLGGPRTESTSRRDVPAVSSHMRGRALGLDSRVPCAHPKNPRGCCERIGRAREGANR